MIPLISPSHSHSPSGKRTKHEHTLPTIIASSTSTPTSTQTSISTSPSTSILLTCMPSLSLASSPALTSYDVDASHQQRSIHDILTSSSSSPESLSSCLDQLKHRIIGSTHHKSWIHEWNGEQHLVRWYDTINSQELKREIVVILGSMASYPPSAHRLISLSLPTTLLTTLSTPLRAHALRTLHHLIITCDTQHRQEICHSLLQNGIDMWKEMIQAGELDHLPSICSILSSIALSHPSHQLMLCEHGLYTTCITRLTTCTFTLALRSLLQLTASLLTDNTQLVLRIVTSHPSHLDVIYKGLTSRDGSIKMWSAACLGMMERALNTHVKGTPPSLREPAITTSTSTSPPLIPIKSTSTTRITNNKRSRSSLIHTSSTSSPPLSIMSLPPPTLLSQHRTHLRTMVVRCVHVIIQLITSSQDAEVKREAPRVLAEMIGDEEELQSESVTAIAPLAALLPSRTITSTHREHIMLALAACSGMLEASRKAVIDVGVVPHVVACLTHQDARLRHAACKCLSSLSRSVRNIRTTLAEAGIALPLLSLLSDPSLDVRASSCSAICNIILDFSPMKRVLLDHNVFHQLCSVLNSSHSPLKLNAVWALANAAFMASQQVKRQILDEVTFVRLCALLSDDDQRIRTQAFSLVRNITDNSMQSASGPTPFALSPSPLFTQSEIAVILDLTTTTCGISPLLLSSTGALLKHACYVVSNLASFDEHMKSIICSRTALMTLIHQHLTHPIDDVRLACLWCIINLTWPVSTPTSEDEHKSNLSLSSRISLFTSMGITATLLSLRNDACVDVRHRVKQALQQMGADGGMRGNTTIPMFFNRINPPASAASAASAASGSASASASDPASAAAALSVLDRLGLGLVWGLNPQQQAQAQAQRDSGSPHAHVHAHAHAPEGGFVSDLTPAQQAMLFQSGDGSDGEEQEDSDIEEDVDADDVAAAEMHRLLRHASAHQQGHIQSQLYDTHDDVDSMMLSLRASQQQRVEDWHIQQQHQNDIRTALLQNMAARRMAGLMLRQRQQQREREQEQEEEQEQEQEQEQQREEE